MCPAVVFLFLLLLCLLLSFLLFFFFFLMIRRPPRSPLFPYTPLFRSYTAMPRARPAGGAVPQPALLAARLSAPRWRGALLSRSRRYSYGSFLAAWASSSMNDSTANALYELFPDRQKPTGIPVSVRG